VLQEKINNLHAGSHNAHRALSAQIDQRRSKLQSKALKQGKTLYKAKPKRFAMRAQQA
jgi:hypothetical protein